MSRAVSDQAREIEVRPGRLPIELDVEEVRIRKAETGGRHRYPHRVTEIRGQPKHSGGSSHGDCHRNVVFEEGNSIVIRRGDAGNEALDSPLSGVLDDVRRRNGEVARRGAGDLSSAIATCENPLNAFIASKVDDGRS